MKKGKAPDEQRLYPFVREIRDIDVFGDGQLYAMWVLEEDMVRARNGRWELSSNARVVNIRLQSPPGHQDVFVSERLLKRIRQRHARKRGILD